MIICINFLKSSNDTFKGKAPPRYYWSKKQEEVIYMSSSMDIWARDSLLGVWVEYWQVFDPGIKTIPIGNSARGCDGVSASYETGLKERHGMIESPQKITRVRVIL